MNSSRALRWSLSLALLVACTSIVGAARAMTMWTTAASTKISGYKGGYQIKHLGRTTEYVYRIELSENGDRPCRVVAASAAQASLTWTDKKLDNCDTPSGSQSVSFSGGANGNRFINAVQVCTSSSTRIKGMKAWGAVVADDGTVTTYAQNPQTWQRTNCKDWGAKAECPSGQVAVGVDLHYQADGPAFVGLALQCAKPGG